MGVVEVEYSRAREKVGKKKYIVYVLRVTQQMRRWSTLHRHQLFSTYLFVKKFRTFGSFFLFKPRGVESLRVLKSCVCDFTKYRISNSVLASPPSRHFLKTDTSNAQIRVFWRIKLMCFFLFWERDDFLHFFFLQITYILFLCLFYVVPTTVTT